MPPTMDQLQLQMILSTLSAGAASNPPPQQQQQPSANNFANSLAAYQLIIPPPQQQTTISSELLVQLLQHLLPQPPPPPPTQAPPTPPTYFSPVIVTPQRPPQQQHAVKAVAQTSPSAAITAVSSPEPFSIQAILGDRTSSSRKSSAASTPPATLPSLAPAAASGFAAAVAATAAPATPAVLAKVIAPTPVFAAAVPAIAPPAPVTASATPTPAVLAKLFTPAQILAAAPPATPTASTPGFFVYAPVAIHPAAPPAAAPATTSARSSCDNVSPPSTSCEPAATTRRTSSADDDEGDMFVDVESVDVAIDLKDRRKAHVEFYRKMKLMRQREKVLTCAVCHKRVDNQENTIQTHVNEHADAGGYQCKICGWQSIDKYRIYDHMRREHPRKVEMFNDKRDMPKMSQWMGSCFPKSTARPKKDADGGADRYLSDLVAEKRSGHAELRCRVCDIFVKCDKHSVMRHVQNAHTLKCKTCKISTINLAEQMVHQKKIHSKPSPKISVDYAPSSAIAYLLPALEKCFPFN